MTIDAKMDNKTMQRIVRTFVRDTTTMQASRHYFLVVTLGQSDVYEY